MFIIVVSILPAFNLLTEILSIIASFMNASFIVKLSDVIPPASIFPDVMFPETNSFMVAKSVVSVSMLATAASNTDVVT